MQVSEVADALALDTLWQMAGGGPARGRLAALLERLQAPRVSEFVGVVRRTREAVRAWGILSHCCALVFALARRHGAAAPRCLGGWQLTPLQAPPRVSG